MESLQRWSSVTDRKAIKMLKGFLLIMSIAEVEDEEEKEEIEETFQTAISALEERDKRSKRMANSGHIRSTCCKYCFDASVDNEIEGYDLSYHFIGKAENDFRFLFRSGGSKPMAILFEKWNVNQWNLIGIYKPKYCPECGRPLKGDE